MEPNLSSSDRMGASPQSAAANVGTSMDPSATCQPLECDKAMACIDGARNPSTTPLKMSELRGELGDCAPCLGALDIEIRLRATMLPMTSELPSPDFRMRITETLASVDLSKLEITDF